MIMRVGDAMERRYCLSMLFCFLSRTFVCIRGTFYMVHASFFVICNTFSDKCGSLHNIQCTSSVEQNDYSTTYHTSALYIMKYVNQHI